MDLTWSALTMLCLGAVGAWFWKNSLTAREAANDAALEACQRLGLQFLDGTVAFTRIAVQRLAGRGLRWRRTYVFDYTADSISRRQGFVVIVGLTIESVGFEQDQVASAAPRTTISFSPPPEIREPGVAPEPPSNVLDLERWRRKRQ